MVTRQRRFSWALPLLLIVFGFVVLGTNLGWLRLDLWRFAQLSPLLLMAAGVDILLGGRHRLAVVLGAVFVGAAIYVGGGLAPGATNIRTETVSQALNGTRRAEIHLQVGVGELRLDTAADGATLLAGSVEALRGERLTQTFRERDGTAFFDLRSERRGSFDFTTSRRVWDLSLSSALPVALVVETGVGRSTLSLTSAQLTRLAVSTGVGEAEVSLPRTGRYEATLNAGVGAVTVRVPRGLAVRLSVSRGIRRGLGARHI